MARPIRVEFPDAVYHVTARGNERQPIVREDPDRERFLEPLEQMVQRFGVAIWAFCLMLNHYHLLLQTPRGEPECRRGLVSDHVQRPLQPSPPSQRTSVPGPV